MNNTNTQYERLKFEIINLVASRYEIFDILNKLEKVSLDEKDAYIKKNLEEIVSLYKVSEKIKEFINKIEIMSLSLKAPNLLRSELLDTKKPLEELSRDLSALLKLHSLPDTLGQFNARYNVQLSQDKGQTPIRNCVLL